MANIELFVSNKCRNFDIHPKYLIKLFGHPKVTNDDSLSNIPVIKGIIDGKELYKTRIKEIDNE